MRHTLSSLAFLSVSLAAPTSTSSLENRQLLGGLLSPLSGLLDSITSAANAGDALSVASLLPKISPANRPSSLADAQARASSIWANPTGRTDIYPAIASQIAAGLGPLLDSTLNTVLTGGLPVGENSVNNNNPPPPSSIYPRKDASDAPYSLSEEVLRKAIYIPAGFTYGAKRPVLFVPGTASYGGSNFATNIRKLLTGTSIADPVWLNVPNAMLDDAQTNAEYVAYAINYLSSITSRSDIAVVSWSQGGLDTQWALKYWPSTRSIVTDFLPVSPDFKGTILANPLCLSANSDIGLNPCPPSVIQQEATSDFVAALRRNGGDSAYVPTTTFYSGFFDEVVEPQQGTIASAFMKDERGVGVSNNEVQRVCAGRLGGGFYGHATTLAHPLTYALIVDALVNEGPGSVNRIDVGRVCDRIEAEGLDLDDFLATGGLIPVAGVVLLTYPDRRLTEPKLREYAR